MNLKICSKCQQSKPLSDYPLDKRNGNIEKYRAECLECVRQRYHIAKSKNPEEMKRKKKDWYVQRTWGISLEDYESLLAEKGRVCGICYIHLDENNIHLDHNHKTDFYRGFLCHKCNVGLGHFDDDINKLKSAITYLSQEIL